MTSSLDRTLWTLQPLICFFIPPIFSIAICAASRTAPDKTRLTTTEQPTAKESEQKEQQLQETFDAMGKVIPNISAGFERWMRNRYSTTVVVALGLAVLAVDADQLYRLTTGSWRYVARLLAQWPPWTWAASGMIHQLLYGCALLVVVVGCAGLVAVFAWFLFSQVWFVGETMAIWVWGAAITEKEDDVGAVELGGGPPHKEDIVNNDGPNVGDGGTTGRS